MSQIYTLRFKLASDGAMGRGDGIAGWIDQEVQHDRYGCPFISGKTIKGILVNECADILFALPETKQKVWEAVALNLFGRPGSQASDQAQMSIGGAQIPADLRQAIQQDIDAEFATLTPTDVLESLTVLRRQTAIDEQTGSAKDQSLRTMRVVLRETSFSVELAFHDVGSNYGASEKQLDSMLQLLAATVRAFRRLGSVRNRGLGRLKEVELVDANDTAITNVYFEKFCHEVG